MEEWKDIKGFDGYQVSNLGRVRSCNKITFTKMHGERHWKDRVLKQKIQGRSNGRKDCRVILWKDGTPYTILVSRLVAFTFLDADINNKQLTVNHINGNSLDNNINNLELVSLKENIQHGFRTGLYTCSRKIKIEDKITGTIILPSSLSEGSKIIEHNSSYLSSRIAKNIWENSRYKWQLI